jgi:nucleoside-diphosphate-sugar epimerase
MNAEPMNAEPMNAEPTTAAAELGRSRRTASGAAAGSVVVLGGTGFLGGHIRATFEAAGWRVRTVSSTATGPGSVRLDLNGVTRWRLDALLDEVAAGVVVNAAGRVWRVTERQMFEANAELVERLAAGLAGRPDRPRLIQLGSVHEYGPGVAGAGTTEDRPTVPVTAYGRSKLRGAQAVLGAADLDGVVLRLANVCGPGTPPGSLLGDVARHLADVARTGRAGTAEAHLRLAPLDAYRDFVDVRDVAEAVLAAAQAPADRVAGNVINVGSGVALPVRRIVARMVALSGLAVQVVEQPDPGPARRDVQWQQLDITRAERLLGWRPRCGLDESLREQLAAA